MANFYKPSYKKQPLKFTNGGEFIVASTLQEYVGFYTQTERNDYYSHPEFNATVSELLLEMPTPMKIDVNTNRYYRLTTLNFPKKEYPLSHIPVLTDEDIRRGYIVRYVAQKRNETNVIMEISKEQFKLSINPATYSNQPGIDTNIWTMYNIQWTISGVYSDIIKNNRKVLNNAEKYIPGISKYFTDLAEYIQVPVTGPDRIYSDGEPVPEQLPTSYQLHTSKQVPLGQACANCMFRFGNGCRKWEAEIRGNHWCRAWKLGNR